MPKVMLIFGTRPEAIKMAPVVLKFKENSNWQTLVCVTAQHRQMLDMVLDSFNIIPDYDLNIMKESQTLPFITTSVINLITPVLQKEKPDIVLVHGDTSTTLAASLAAFYEKIPIAHVEAGLRTDNIQIPFPEEMNRRVTDTLCTYWFPPTKIGAKNLIKEGYPKQNIIVTGNTVIDALFTIINKHINYDILEEFGLKDKKEYKLILVTAHRRESWGEPIKNICEAIRTVVKSFDDIVVLFSTHPNPKVQEIVNNSLAGIERVIISKHIDYVPFCKLMAHSYIILTDSGGIQEEAPSLGKPVLVLRDVTERPEAIEAGTAILVGTDKDRIVKNLTLLLKDNDKYNQMARSINPYGDGKASERIVNSLSYYSGLTNELPKPFEL